MPHENKFPNRAHAENKLYMSKPNLTAPPPFRIKQSSPYIAHQTPQRITDKLSVAHCALRVAPFTTSHKNSKKFCVISLILKMQIQKRSISTENSF